MSHIFDGLQRSEDECSDIDISALSGVTELLRHVERRTAAKWETTLPSKQHEVPTSPDHDISSDIKERPSVADIVTMANPRLVDEDIDLFGQCQPLQVSLSSQSRLPCLSDNRSPAAEAFRLLGVRLRHLQRDRLFKKLLITSTIPQEGKSTVAANLACTFGSEAQRRVLLLEGDLRRPSLSQIFGVGKNRGLSEWLDGDRKPIPSIYYLEDANIWILPAGSASSNALELLQSVKLTTLMNQLTVLFDWIVIDSPPVLPLADTSVWMRLTDGILLTTRQGTTEKRKLQRGLGAIEPNKLIGALVNSSNSATNSEYYYYSSPAASDRPILQYDE